MTIHSTLASCSALVLIACATGVVEDSMFGATVDAGRPGDSGNLAQGGDGGAEPTAAGGAPALGGAGPGTGGTGTGTASGGAPATGGVPASGGTTMGGVGGMLAASGGVVSGAGGSPGAGGSCGTGQKLCAGVCVVQTATNGCSAASCTACPIPAPTNGLQICDGQGQCDFECLSGYQKSGNQCSRSAGAGGSAGTGGGGAAGALTCGTHKCGSCLGNLVACCDKGGKLCLCVLSNATNLCG